MLRDLAEVVSRRSLQAGADGIGEGYGRVAQLVRALLSHSRGPGFESLRAHSSPPPAREQADVAGVPSPPSQEQMQRSAGRVVGLLALLASAVALPSATALAQRPDAATAQQLLQTRPDLVEQLRQRIMQSGLTADQVRARLKAEGYPENLLDAYLPGSGARPDSSKREEAMSAIRALGIADSTDLAGLVRRARAGAPGDTTNLDALLTEGAPTGAGRAGRDAAQVRLQADSGFTIFGSELFRGPASRFAPNATGPVDANYRLGPGDRLVLILTGDVEVAHDLPVTREGFIVIPQVGQVFVNNLTLGDLENVLYGRLGRVYSGVRRGGGSTRFSVSVANLRSLQVFVVGDVDQPGSYRISSAGTAFSALFAAGGPTRNGSFRRIEIRRGGKIVDSLDVYDYLLRGDATHDVRLETGDVVFVAPHGPRVRVSGEVIRPATYEARAGESVADVLKMTGGFTELADQRRVLVERVLPPGQRTAEGRDRTVLEVSMAGAATARTEAGDVIRAGAISDRVRGRVMVRGNVWAPGSIAVGAGMKLSDALRKAGGPKPDSYLGRVLISRLRSDSTRVQLRAALRDTTGAAIDDLPLQDDDEVRVFSLTEFRPLRFVSIAGAVRKGGRFPYREGMTVRDLVLLGGGLDQSAFLNEAEVARLPENRQGGVTATTVRIPLDSSYLFERTPDGRYIGPPGIPAPAGPGPDVPLQAYDYVLILRQPEWSLQRAVWVTGEVKFPGRYTLKSQGERLSDVVARAGGLTALAYPEGAAFTRARDSVGRVGIDLPRALRDREFRDNMVLQDGDSLAVPQLNPVVIVRGEVNAPTAVAYRPGEGIAYYVKSAGGAKRTGDARGAFVTQANGHVEATTKRWLLFPDGQPVPMPGAVVSVPLKDLTEETETTQRLTAWLGILTSIATLAVVVSRR